MHTIWKVCKSVCCERNVSVKAMYVRMAKLGTNGPVTCFTKIHISLWLLDPNQMGSSLKCREIVIFSLHEIIFWFIHYFESYPCGKSDCNFFLGHMVWWFVYIIIIHACILVYPDQTGLFWLCYIWGGGGGGILPPPPRDFGRHSRDRDEILHTRRPGHNQHDCIVRFFKITNF